MHPVVFTAVQNYYCKLYIGR